MTPFEKKILLFLSTELSLSEFESWVYSHSEIEYEIGPNCYLDLIATDFRSEEEITSILKQQIKNICDFSSLSPRRFGIGLKRHLVKGSSFREISNWAYEERVYSRENIGPDFYMKIMTIESLDEGPEFELSQKELNELADQLIAEENCI